MTDTALSTRVFVGTSVSAELRMHLNSSILWKHSQIQPGGKLSLVHFQQHDYLGAYIDGEQLTLPILSKFSEELKSVIQEYCPSLQAERLPFQVFPQLFVA
jgi:hypothetical protein